MLYRILTEDIDGTEEIVSDFFKSFTLIHAVGFDEGTREYSLIIEIYGDKSDRAKIGALANRIRFANSQRVVIVAVHDSALFYHAERPLTNSMGAPSRKVSEKERRNQALADADTESLETLEAGATILNRLRWKK